MGTQRMTKSKNIFPNTFRQERPSSVSTEDELRSTRQQLEDYQLKVKQLEEDLIMSRQWEEEVTRQLEEEIKGKSRSPGYESVPQKGIAQNTRSFEVQTNVPEEDSEGSISLEMEDGGAQEIDTNNQETKPSSTQRKSKSKYGVPDISTRERPSSISTEDELRLTRQELEEVNASRKASAAQIEDLQKSLEAYKLKNQQLEDDLIMSRQWEEEVTRQLEEEIKGKNRSPGYDSVPQKDTAKNTRPLEKQFVGPDEESEGSLSLGME